MRENGGSEEEEEVKMEEENDEKKRYEVLMWGYLPGVLSHKSPLTSPVEVQLPEIGVEVQSWKDVCGGGCGFAMAISGSGKLITWGSADDQGQSYLTSGKHGVCGISPLHGLVYIVLFELILLSFFITTFIKETPEQFLLPTEDPIVKAAAGWAHCVSVTEKNDVYTWGWKECVPSSKVVANFASGGSFEGDAFRKESALTDQESPQSQGSKSIGDAVVPQDNKKPEETAKRRRTTMAKQELESSPPADESLSAPPCIVELDPGVKITSVAAGGRHTLALSDVGQVWGWGYGGEGQLGLGSRIKTVASPHLIPCLDTSSHGPDRSLGSPQRSITTGSQKRNALGSYIKRIACGGRHSAVITDAGVLLTFGWGLYGQCGLGNTNDVLRPTCVSSLLNTRIEAVAGGLWHSVCLCDHGRVYTFGGNQFGQLGLGTGTDHTETSPRLVDASILENEHAKVVSCGARHSAIMTEDSKIYSWGWNKYGQLGLGDTIDRNDPFEVPIDDCTPKNVACGWWHTLLLAESRP
ncbi:ultraviolet-B receptor UVR8-like isoform X2 [Solanum dulcamara]|uniref:ultraviolet-B receptor UVR8-like isoform X2 n=1 Tax=Solanum dulcamara TaxID=45834 RepID=UPI002485EF6C|nr:ultraviolet-B receptor UVR8-like isoform X2 [Solanum dulcamara]